MAKPRYVFFFVAVLTLLVVAGCWFTTEPNQVAKPTFNLPGGTYECGLRISIVCATPEVTIFYTMDGSEPNLASLIYTEPVNIFQTTTFKAKAYKNDMQGSNTAKITYIISSLPVPENFTDVQK